MGKNQLRENKGFTLVEVMIAVAIVGFVIVSITTFMVVGSRTFASTSSEVNLQHESQLAYNQLQDMIIDTTLGITLAYVDAGGNMADAGVNVLDDSAIPASAAYKKLYMYNETVAYVVIWEEATSRLFYEEHDVTVDALGNISTTPRLTNARMADYITHFGVDLNRLEEKRIARVDMGFEKNNKTYESSYNITLRNSIVVNEPLSSITIPTPPIHAGSVDINDIVVEPGTVYTYTTEVFDEDGSRSANQNVRWTSEDTGLPDTGIDIATGRLQISPYETATEFTVSVTSEDGLATDSATVHVRRVRRVSITEEAHTGTGAASNRYEAGDEITLKAEINDGVLPEELTSGVSPTTSIAQFEKIDWECILLNGAEDYLDIISTTDEATGGKCVVKIKQSGLIDGMEIRVRANSTHSRGYGRNEDSIVYDDWYRTVYQEEPDFDIQISPGDYLRGQEYVVINPGDIANNINKYVLLYDFTLKRKDINEIGNVTGYTVLERHWQEVPFWQEGGNNCKLRLPIDMDPEPYKYDQYVLDIVAYAVSIPRLYDQGKRAICYNPADGYNINAPGVLVSKTKSIEVKPIHMYFGDVNQHVQFFAPRTFYTSNQSSNNEVFIPANAEIGVSNILRGGEFQLNNESVKWKAYQVDPSKSNGLGAEYNIDPELLRINFEGGIKFKMAFNKERWNNALPASVRYVPTIKVVNNKNGNTEYYQLYQSYVDIVFHNIDILGEKLYFPYPGQDEFPGKELTRDTEMTGTWYKAKNFTTTYQYRLSCYETNGMLEYSLSIYENGGLSNPDRRIAVYKINEGQTSWRKN